jgi:manganese/zinc/iron transport system substrate-binding protein
MLGGCSENKSVADEKIKIITTTGMIQDAASFISKDFANVEALIGPGVDPHLYKASQGDLEKLTSAQVVFYNGLHLEGKMNEVLEKLARIKPVISVSKDIPDSLLREAPGFGGTHDPHIWFDVKLWKHAAVTISKSLIDLYPAHNLTITQNRNDYLSLLDSLDNLVRKDLSEIPEKQRILVTAHDAFGYFGDAYQIEVHGLQGISTLSEFGLRDVTNLVAFITGHQIKAIFTETSVSTKSIEAVVEGCRKRGWAVKIGGALYSDAMGAPGTAEGTYFGMVRANSKLISNALK